MPTIQVSELKYSRPDGSAIDAMISIDGGEVIPFTLVATDPEPLGRELHAKAVAGELGTIAPYVPPAPVVPTVVTMRQARLALLGAGLLSQVTAALDAMPGAEGEAARIEWEYAAELRRDHPLTQSLAGALGLSDVSLDTLFTQAAAL